MTPANDGETIKRNRKWSAPPPPSPMSEPVEEVKMRPRVPWNLK
jgi:hypothetical protein